jgi:methionine-rich copper-binding protein CopC
MVAALRALVRAATGRWRGCLRAGAALALVFAATLGVGLEPAVAHAALERSLPGAGAQLDVPPTQVELFFAENLVQNRTGTFAVVYDNTGAVVSAEGRIDPRDGKHFTVPLRGSLGSGTYVVFWKTTSDDDGGVTLGNFGFSVGMAATPVAQQGPLGGQVLVPDDLQSRALAMTVRGDGGGTSGAAIAALVVGGIVAGGMLTYAAQRLYARRRRPSPAAARGRRR